MELEELRNKWQNLSGRVDELERENRRMASAIAAGKAVSAKTKLARLYTRTGACGLLLPSMAPLIVFVLDFQIWVAVLYAVSGLILATINFRFASFIRSRDYMSMPVVEAMENVLAIRKRQSRIRFFGVCLALVILGAFLSECLAEWNEGIVFGFIAGLVLGSIIAFLKFRHINKLVSQMERELASVIE